jgi:hypothetical protein
MGGCALEDVFVALNAADWQHADCETVTQHRRAQPARVSRRLQLKAQVRELIDLYSLQHLFGAPGVKPGLLMDTLCLAVKQLLKLSGCWLVNGSVVMGSSQPRTPQLNTVALPDCHSGAVPPDHAIWSLLGTNGPAFGYAVPCQLFRQTGGYLLLRSDYALPNDLPQRFAEVLGASIQLQHQLWQIEDALGTATESQLQHYRTELTEWVLTLLEHQNALMTVLSEYICQRHGLPGQHPLRVAQRAQQLALQLGWSEDLADALALSGMQVALEGVQWSKLLQNGQRPWAEDDYQRARMQREIGWLMLSQFLPLVTWPAQDWTPTDPPSRLLALVREYCALTEKRAYRKNNPTTGKPSVRQHQLAIKTLQAQGQWPADWLTALAAQGV